MKHAFLDKYAGLESPVHALDARAKIVAFFTLIVLCVSTPPDRWEAFAGYFAFLALVGAASTVPPVHILRRAAFGENRLSASNGQALATHEMP